MRGSAIRLRPDDRDSLLPLLDDAIAAADARHDAESYRAAQTVHAAVELAAGRGDDWAGRVIAACATEGLRLLILARQNEDRGTVALSRSGQVVSLPARVGMRRRVGRGAGSKRFQRPLWWELDWDEFEAFLDGRVTARDAAAVEVAALQEIARLRAQFPGTRCPREACQAAGIDPRKFALP